jgi:hypothetical protein
LKKIADCGEDIGDGGGEDEAEKELTAMQTFNVHSGDSNVLAVSIGQVTEDKTLCTQPPSHTDDGKSDGTFDPSADQTDPGTKDVVPACCSEDPAGACCGKWRAKYESNEVASGGYTGGSMAGMFFLGMFSVLIIGAGVVFVLRRRHSEQNGSSFDDNSSGTMLEPMFSSSSTGVGGATISETEYSAL